MRLTERIAILGAGRIGMALMGGMIKADLVELDKITATARSEATLERIQQRFSVKTHTDNRDAVQRSQVIILAVKPQNIREVLQEIAPVIQEQHLIISVAAGITTRAIQQALNQPCPIIRAMPNIPVVVDAGATAIAPGSTAEDRHLRIARAIFEAVGEVVVVRESQLDAVTGLSGSRPAYIYMVIEALIEGGVKMGLSRDIATRLSVQTVLGAAKLMKESGQHPAVLRDEVTTPGGTAIAAIHELEEHALRNMLISAVETATRRSQELRQLLNHHDDLS